VITSQNSDDRTQNEKKKKDGPIHTFVMAGRVFGKVYSSNSRIIAVRPYFAATSTGCVGVMLMVDVF